MKLVATVLVGILIAIAIQNEGIIRALAELAAFIVVVFTVRKHRKHRRHNEMVKIEPEEIG
ncbi:hypothetical protein [Vibrio maerlii]|uniref:hypothetical protein n=1 Tax=Vibrio maerlii TaxID=2231648 RepID=UPI000E3D9E17|nr:hypothetical protein [Vibrio maerlii]